MSDIKIIKVSSGGAKVDSSGFFIKPKSSESSQPSQPSQPSQLSQFIEQEKKSSDKKSYEDDDDNESVDSMSVSDVSSATNQSHEESEYTSESMNQPPLLPPPSQFPKVSSIVKDETLNSYLEKPKVELPKSEEEAKITIPPVNIIPQQPTNLNVSSTETVQTTTQPVNNRNDYYSDTEEDVIDMTDNKLYDILSSVLEDEDGENVSENMAKMNRNLEKVITMFEAYQQNNTKDEYLSKISEAIENQNKILTQMVNILEKKSPNQELNEVKEKHEKHEKHEKSHDKHEKSESLTDENTDDTDDTEKNPNIKKVKISNTIKKIKETHLPLKHRIQIKHKN